MRRKQNLTQFDEPTHTRRKCSEEVKWRGGDVGGQWTGRVQGTATETLSMTVSGPMAAPHAAGHNKQLLLLLLSALAVHFG